MTGNGRYGRLIRVTSSKFVAGIVIDKDRCVHAPPILRWSKGRRLDDLLCRFDQRGWAAEEKVDGEWQQARRSHHPA